MVLDLSRTIDDIMAKADKQTAATRDTFNIPDAAGIVVILNERAVELRPDVIYYALWNTFQKKTSDGAFRYAANDTIILISEANLLVSSGADGTRGFPIVIFTSPARGHNATAKEFSESLIEKWAAFNGAPLKTMPVDVNLKPK